MRFPLRFVLVLTAIIAAAFLVLVVACGGGEKESPKASPTATAAKTPTAATKTPAAGETPEKTPAGGAGEVPSIATYPGASEVFTGTFDTGGTFPFPLSPDVPVDPAEFGNVQYTVYQTNDSSDKVIDFYEGEFKGWKNEGSFDMEGMDGEVMMWSKDDGKIAAWMGIFGEEGGASFVIATGVRQ